MLAKGAASLQHINNARCKSKHPDNATALPPAEHSETATPMAYKHTAMQSSCERWWTPDVMTVKELLSFYLNTPTPWGEKVLCERAMSRLTVDRKKTTFNQVLMMHFAVLCPSPPTHSAKSMLQFQDKLLLTCGCYFPIANGLVGTLFTRRDVGSNGVALYVSVRRGVVLSIAHTYESQTNIQVLTVLKASKNLQSCARFMNKHKEWSSGMYEKAPQCINGLKCCCTTPLGKDWGVDGETEASCASGT